MFCILSPGFWGWRSGILKTPKFWSPYEAREA